MCGLAGFLGDFSADLLPAMAKRIAHRGPDGDGFFHHPQHGIGLAHRRLSIIDLSNAAAQPMACVGGRYQVVFNGEIYNFKTFVPLLQEKGYQFNPNSDSAVLAPLYDLYGVEMLQKLSGIFVFVIWDTQEQTLFIARDHVGTKPIYYAQTSAGFLFASELKALLAAEGVGGELDISALENYVTYLWSPGGQTPFLGVKKLKPGHYLQVKSRVLHEVRWYRPPLPLLRDNKPEYTPDYSAENLLARFDKVVNEQLLADVPVGAFLSGGVDSSGIVASMCVQNQPPAASFCITFAGKEMAEEGFSDDAHYARIVARRYGLRLTEVQADPHTLEHLPAMIYALDEPQADPAPLYVKTISDAARSMGIKVLMSGAGGDDIFSGYRRHRLLASREWLGETGSNLVGALLRKTAPFVSSSSGRRRLEKSAYMYGCGHDEALERSYHFTPRAIANALFSDQARAVRAQQNQSSWFAVGVEESRGQHMLNRSLYQELFGFLPDHNLNYTDKLGMAGAIEIRVPYLDPALMAYAATLPPRAKSRGGVAKYLLKKAFEPRLPPEVLYRPKAGFGAPVRQWLAGPAFAQAQDLLTRKKFIERGLFNPAAVRQQLALLKNPHVDNAYTVLALMCIEYWCQAFIDRQGAGDA